MSQQLGGQPILILREGARRTRGQEAQSGNFAAAKAVAHAVRSTLGPNGMDKMLIDGIGDIVITNDGATILKEMDIEHPVAKMMVEVAKTQDDETGDGTTTAVVLAGELLRNAEELLLQKIHPTVIAEGYLQGARKAQEILSALALEIRPDDEAMLKSIAETAFTSRLAESAKDQFCGFMVRAVTVVQDPDGKVNIDHISVVKKVGGAIEDSTIIDGIVIDKERMHPGMPKEVRDARILLLNAAIEFKKTEVNAKINIADPSQSQAFLDEEAHMVRSMVDKVIASGANVVFCQKGIDDVAQHYLAKAKVLAVRRLKKSDMENLSRATGASIVNSIDAAAAADIGSAGLVLEKKVAGEEMITVSECKNPKAVSIIIHGGTQHVVDELERSVHDGLMVVKDVVEDGRMVAGGGAPEIELSMRLREYAVTQGGRRQLAIERFASAFEVIPRTLAENSGLDPIDMIVALRSAHEKGHATYGLDVTAGKPADMLKAGVVEPLRVKTQAISSAADAAVMILRIDDVIASSKAKEAPTPPGGMGGY
ncbi:MAG: thermosome subunit alpha [Methanoregula sp.]|nr:MAG: thermosome subunit alpha [Methanoregula sp.]